MDRLNYCLYMLITIVPEDKRIPSKYSSVDTLACLNYELLNYIICALTILPHNEFIKFKVCLQREPEEGRIDFDFVPEDNPNV